MWFFELLLLPHRTSRLSPSNERFSLFRRRARPLDGRESPPLQHAGTCAEAYEVLGSERAGDGWLLDRRASPSEPVFTGHFNGHPHPAGDRPNLALVTRALSDWQGGRWRSRACRLSSSAHRGGTGETLAAPLSFGNAEDAAGFVAGEGGETVSRGGRCLGADRGKSRVESILLTGPPGAPRAGDVEVAADLDRINCYRSDPGRTIPAGRQPVAPAFLGLEAGAQAAARPEGHLSRPPQDDNPGPRLGYAWGCATRPSTTLDLPVAEPPR